MLDARIELVPFATAWALRQDCGGATGKSILMALASAIGNDGLVHISRRKLVERTELSERSVRTWLNKLENLGLVRRTVIGKLSDSDSCERFMVLAGSNERPEVIKKIQRRIGPRTLIPAEIRDAVFARDGEKCVYCGDEAGPFHLDHKLPWSRGGKDTIENLVVACRSCNLSKRDRTPEEMGWDVS